MIKATVYTAIAMVFYALGEICSKYFANNTGLSTTFKYGFAAVFFYCITSALWLPVIREKNSLTIMSVLWTVFYALIGVALGQFMFHEKINAFNGIGICLAIVSVIFLCL